MRIILEATVETIASRVDGTIVLKIGTQELDPSKAGELFQLRGKLAKVLLSDSNITKLEEELVDNTSLVQGKSKNKSPSQRLRNVLYRVHENSGGDKDDFDKFYGSEVERIIEHYKSKIE